MGCFQAITKLQRYIATMKIQICLFLGFFGIVSGQSASLPCQETERDPDDSNPTDNLICPFFSETDCINGSQICDCVNKAILLEWGSGFVERFPGVFDDPASYYYDENFGVHSIDCPNSTFQCSPGEEYLPFSALCNGTNECSSGADETNAFCENKCSRPYFGNCGHNEQCVQWGRQHGAWCECSTGYTRYYSNNYDCKADVRFQHGCYIGRKLGKYIPSICVGVIDSFNWEEFFVSNDATTISTDLIVHYRDYPVKVFLKKFEVTLNATHPQLCYDLDYSNIERFLYNSREEFSLDLLETNISSGSREYLIMYDSYIHRVSIERIHNKVSEASTVDVCVYLTNGCCLEINGFAIDLSVSLNSTGYGIDSVSYNVTLNISSCEDSCVSLPFEDDNVPEYEEYYRLSLVRPPGLPEWIEVNSDTEIIHIIDDDDVLIGFHQNKYTATEVEGQVSVCVGPINTKETRHSYEVALLPEKDFETSNTAEDCYKILEFTPGQLQQCHNYSIENDQNCTLERQFEIRLSLLSSNDNKIRVDSSSSTTTIVIDDSRDEECFVRVGFKETSLTVTESQESVEICFNSTSPGIEEDFTVNITSDNEGFFQEIQLSSNSTDPQCYKKFFNTSDICMQHFTECNDIPVTLKLIAAANSSVIITENILEIMFKVPNKCLCSEATSSSSLGDAGIAAVVLGILVAVVLLVTTLVLVTFFYRERRKKSVWGLSTVDDHHYVSLGEGRRAILLQHLRQQLENKNMIYSKDQIQLSTTVGQGESGLVYKGYIITSIGKELVAIKTGKALFSTNDLERLAKEVSTMLSFQHENVMSLIGVCIDGEMPLLIMPFMSKGSVLEFVRKHKECLLFVGESVTQEVQGACKQLLKISYHITKGMEYLSSHKFVHRDLAARNCMIDGNGVIKVADFGLTEDMYGTNYYRRERSETGSEEKVPIRWMAPESIEYNIYTEATDVWSYGVTVWEIFTCGAIPYGGVHAMSLLKELQRGKRLEKPNNMACHDDIYEVMLSCWELEAKERPKFSDLIVTVNNLLERDAGYLELSVSPTTIMKTTFEPDMSSPTFSDTKIETVTSL